MTVLTFSVNGKVYIEILTMFLISSAERLFGDYDHFQDDDVSKDVKNYKKDTECQLLQIELQIVQNSRGVALYC